MSEKYCPACNAPVPPESMNIAQGVALCPECGELSKLSDIVERDRPDNELTGSAPAGCHVYDRGLDVLVFASTRSLVSALGALGICLFWNGIVSVFVAVAVSGLYLNLIGPVPDWFPAPVMNDEQMGLGMTLFLCLFLVPFVTVGTGMLFWLLMSVFGKVEVVVGDQEAKVRTGIGPLTWNRRFNPDEVKSVLVRQDRGRWDSEGTQEYVFITADKTVKFGSTLADDKKQWMRSILQILLREKNPARVREMLGPIMNPGN